MKRAWIIIIGGLLLAGTGYACIYLTCTASQRFVGKNEKPALAWLRQEYQLSDAQFARVRELHEAYHPRCLEMCRKIDEKNGRLRELLATTNVITLEIKQTLAQAAQLR